MPTPACLQNLECGFKIGATQIARRRRDPRRRVYAARAKSYSNMAVARALARALADVLVVALLVVVLTTAATLRMRASLTVAAKLDADSPALVSNDDAFKFYERTFGCAYDDDDALFLNRENCITGDRDTCYGTSEYPGFLNATSAFSEGGECFEACGSDLERTWGVPCAWQLVADLPNFCAGEATVNPTQLFESRNLEPEDAGVIFDLEKDGATYLQYDCEFLMRRLAPRGRRSDRVLSRPPRPLRAFFAGNLHAFCNTCSQANGTVNRYCAAVATYYNSFTNAEAPFRHLDFWCMGDVLAALEDGLDVFTALFGVHEDCAHTYCTQGARS